MKARTKKILNFVLIFGTLALVILLNAGDQDIGAAFHALGSINLRWIVLCTLSFLGFLCCDALSIWYFLRRQGYRLRFDYVLFVSITGQYYSNITPGASGGQPMQIYYLHKRSVPVGIATSALIVRFFSFQFMLQVLATAFWIGNAQFVAENVADKMWILWVGYIYNGVMVLALLLLAINKRIVAAMLRFIIRVGAKLRIIRNPESVQVKWLDVLDNFHGSIMMLRHHPGDLLIQLALGGLQLMSLMTVIYFVYLGLGLRGASYGQLVAVDIMEYVSAAYTPLPGASGAQEGVFTWYFGRIFTSELTLAALLTWRFFTYYLSLIIGAVTSVVYGLSGGTTAKEIPDAKELKD